MFRMLSASLIQVKRKGGRVTYQYLNKFQLFFCLVEFNLNMLVQNGCIVLTVFLSEVRYKIRPHGFLIDLKLKSLRPEEHNKLTISS